MTSHTDTRSSAASSSVQPVRTRAPGVAPAVCGAVAVVAGLALPWMKVSAPAAGLQQSTTGFDPELFGIPILALAAIAVGCVLAASRHRALGLLGALSGLGVLGLVSLGLLKADSTRLEIEALATGAAQGAGFVLGAGIAVTFVGSLLLIVGDFQAARRGRPDLAVGTSS